MPNYSAFKNKNLLLRYLAVLTLLSLLTVAIVFLSPYLGRIIIPAYIFIFIILSFFKEEKIIFFAGGAAFLSYLYLFFYTSTVEILSPNTDLPVIFVGLILVYFIAKSFRGNCLSLIKAQEDLETTKASLEIRIKARTKELRQMSKRLEEQVRERTKELQKKIEELERFNKLAVGRELKMIELKKEINSLKDKKYDKGSEQKGA